MVYILLLFIILNHNNFAINIDWMFRNGSIFHSIDIMNLVRNCSQLDINPTSIEDLFASSRWSGRFMAWWVGLGVMSIKSGGCICCRCTLRTPMFYSTWFTYVDAIFKANQPINNWNFLEHFIWIWPIHVKCAHSGPENLKKSRKKTREVK